MKKVLLAFALPFLFPFVAVAGTQSYTTPGTYSFTVPSYLSLSVDVKGGGGGGGSPPSNYWGFEEFGTHYGYAGTAGGLSRFESSVNVVGNGASGGSGGDMTKDGSGYYWCNSGSAGAAGTGSGGDTNTTGGGASGGSGGSVNAPDYSCSTVAGAGGSGGRAQKTWSSGSGGAPSAGASITVVVGAGGGGGGAGSNGSVSISWTENSAPSAPSISGVSSGYAGASYAFTFSGSTDPDGNSIRFGLDWDNNGSVDEWTGYVSSGSSSQLSRTWGSAGTYTFKALAQDSYGSNSGWSSTKSVTITDYAAAVRFTRPVTVAGNLNISANISKGSGTFVIDHPLDPANKLLFHSFVESPDAKNLYDGTAVVGADGTAIIELPSYMFALNRDFRYIVKPLDAPMPDLYVSKTVAPRLFSLFGAPVFAVAGGVPGGTISWQVTGTRRDPYILAHPIVPETVKGPGTPYAQGMYVFPDAYLEKSGTK